MNAVPAKGLSRLSDDDFKFDPRTDIDITGLEWWEVLQRLHRATKGVGPFSLMNRPLSDEHAMELIAQHIQGTGDSRRFDYVNGRPMKISFHTKHGRSWVHRIDLYNRDAPTPAHQTIAALRKEKAARYHRGN